MIFRPELVEKILAGEIEAARILEPGYVGSVRRYPSRWQEENLAAWGALIVEQATRIERTAAELVSEHWGWLEVFVTPSVSVFKESQAFLSPLPREVEVRYPSPLYTPEDELHQCFIDVYSKLVHNFCMMFVMVKEADLNRIEVPDDYEVLDATALGSRLGFKRDTVLAYLSRRNFGRIPRPNRQLAMGPIWYEKCVREWEAKEEGRARGKY